MAVRVTMVFTSTSRRFLTCILTLAGCIGLLSAPQLVQAQQESSPTSAPFASLEEANQLDKQIQELKKQGKYEEAIPIARRELGIREKALGPEHPDVVVSLNTLGELLWRQGEYQEAEQLRKRAELILSKEPAKPTSSRVLHKRRGRPPLPDYAESYSAPEPPGVIISKQALEEKQYTHIPVFYGTDRKENLKEHYGGDRGEGLRLGICDVTIPRDHRSANIESLRVHSSPLGAYKPRATQSAILPEIMNGRLSEPAISNTP